MLAYVDYQTGETTQKQLLFKLRGTQEVWAFCRHRYSLFSVTREFPVSKRNCGWKIKLRPFFEFLQIAISGCSPLAAYSEIHLNIFMRCKYGLIRTSGGHQGVQRCLFGGEYSQ